MHTKEPWKIHEDVRGCKSILGNVTDDPDEGIFTCTNLGYTHGLHCEGEDRSNAIRICDCVNALAGYNPEALAELVEEAEDALQMIVGHLGDGLGSIGERDAAGLRKALADFKGETDGPNPMA